MSSIKTVVVAGASGNLGPSVLNSLVGSGKFSVTVIKRQGSKSEFPASVKVVEVDYDSVESLTAAFQGQDAVVSIIATMASKQQEAMIDAAVAAGVKRFIPSEFGSDLGNEKTAALPVFGAKVAMLKYVQERAKANPDFTYTAVRNSGFLDWGLKVGFLFNASEYKPTIYDGGDQLFSATTLDTIGQSIVGILSHPDETANRAVYIQDVAISQNKLLEMAKKLTPGKTWEPVHVSTAEMKAASDEKLAKGQMDHSVMLPYIFSSIFAEGYGGHFQKLDNELLGIKGMSDEEVGAYVKAALPKA